MATTTEPSRTFLGVQALRAVAALMVVGQHGAQRWNVWINHISGEMDWSNGEAGVDLFFVISGFVMMVSAPALLGRPHPGRTFLRRRCIRIVPLYWLFTTLTVIKLSFGFSAAHRTNVSAWHVIASYLFIPSLDDDLLPFPLLGVGWTLQFEMIFYLLFAASLALEIAPLTVLTPTLLAIAAAGWFNNPSWPAVFRGLASPLVLEFVTGAMLGHFALRRCLPGRRMGAVLLLGGLVAIFTMPRCGIWRAFCWGLPATAIVAGAVALEDFLGPNAPRWMLELGNASYSIYLVHLFVVPFGWVAAQRLGMTGVPALVGIVLASLLASAVAGEAVHLLLELPLTNFLRGRRASVGGNGIRER